MKSKARQIVGGIFIVGGAVAYVWLMAAELVPAAVELAEAFGVPLPGPVAWIGLTVAALAVTLVVDRRLSRNRKFSCATTYPK